MLATVKWAMLFAALFYAGIGAAMYVWQRSLMYFPERMRTPPAAAGLSTAAEVTLESRDGVRLVAWHRAPAEGAPVFLYFHGNGGSLRLRAERFRQLTAGGAGLVALSYRGYAGSEGAPTEAGIMLDAEAAYAFAAARYRPERLVAFGESLGTAVAVRIAAEHPVGTLVLDAPYTSTADIAAAIYWWLPVRLLMKDQFRAADWIARVRAPVLVLHGEGDRVIPIAFADRLYAMVRAPKRFIRYPRGGHSDLDLHGAQEAIRDFVNAPPSAT